ncbi:MAG: stage III sporulation protein AB [Anaerovoracaceae bacterium]
MFKGILCAVIVLSCGCLGIVKSMTFSQRLLDLLDLKNMIKILETEMSYKKDPLPSAFQRISTYKDNPAMNLLSQCNVFMKKNMDFQCCWNKGIDAVFGKRSLTVEDLICLKDMGLQLGKSDIEGQKAMFSVTMIKLEQQIKEAEENKKTKGKMYKSLGFSIGAVIAIILI